MNKQKNPLYDSKIQKILNKLIAEETIANNFYIGCVMVSKKEERHLFDKLFIETADDELNDHCKHLVEWATENDYSVIFKYKDLEKYADERVVKQMNTVRSDADASYYVNEAIKSEDYAIESYQEAMKYDGLPQDLNAILIQNYYDEVEHKEDLQTTKNAIDNQVDLIW